MDTGFAQLLHFLRFVGLHKEYPPPPWVSQPTGCNTCGDGNSLFVCQEKSRNEQEK